jgi:hypothetical protein
MAGEWGRYCKLRADAHVLSECSDQEEVLPVVTLWGRQWSREELLAGAGRLVQVAGDTHPRGGIGWQAVTARESCRRRCP